MQKNQKKEHSASSRVANIFLILSIIFFVAITAVSLLRKGDSNNQSCNAQSCDAQSPAPAAIELATSQISPASTVAVSPSPITPAASIAVSPSIPTPSNGSKVDDATIREHLSELGKVEAVEDLSPGLRRWSLSGETENEDGQRVQAKLNVFQIGDFLVLGTVHKAESGEFIASSVVHEPEVSQQDESEGAQDESQDTSTTGEAAAEAAEQVASAAQPASSAVMSPASAASATQTAKRAEAPASAPKPSASAPASAPTAAATSPVAMSAATTTASASAASTPTVIPQPSAKFGLQGEWQGSVSPVLDVFENLPGAVVGDASMKPQDSVYIFFDPRCPYCKQTYAAVKDNWPQRRVKWIPGVLLGETDEAYAMAASVMDTQNGSANLNTIMTGGNLNAPAATKEQREQLIGNAAMLFALVEKMDPGSRVGVPAMYWLHRPNGLLSYANGVAQKEALEKVFGPTNTK